MDFIGFYFCIAQLPGCVKNAFPQAACFFYHFYDGVLGMQLFPSVFVGIISKTDILRAVEVMNLKIGE